MPMEKRAQWWIVNLIAFASGSLVAVTGLINWLVLPRGGGRHDGWWIGVRHALMQVHVWLALLFVAAIAVHLVQHGSIIRSNLARMGWLKK